MTPVQENIAKNLKTVFEQVKEANLKATKQVNDEYKTVEGRARLGVTAEYNLMQTFLNEHRETVRAFIVEAKPEGYFVVRALLNDTKYGNKHPLSCIFGDMTGAMTDLLKFFNNSPMFPMYVFDEVVPASFTTNLSGHIMYAEEPKKPTKWVIEITNGNKWERLKREYSTPALASTEANALFGPDRYRVVAA
jgi:hypothetical protein